MPKVESFTVNGLRLWFLSDDHMPPHFHAERAGEWAVRVLFMRSPEDMIEHVYSVKRNRPNKSDVRELKKLAIEHRAALFIEWESKVNVKAPGQKR